MKKTIILLLSLILLISCSGDNSSSLSSNIVVGDWNLISQKISGLETITECSKQTIFSFKSNTVLSQQFFSVSNAVCSSSSLIISSWVSTGNSQYEIRNSSGILSILEFVFSSDENQFTVSETNENDTPIISVFKRAD